MNRIFSEQLQLSLNKRLSTVYYLVGQDPLLLTESRDAIVQTAILQGFDEKLEITVDHTTNWRSILEQAQSMGLFFKRQMLILTLPENPTALIQRNLQELITLLHTDILLILQMAKLTKPMEKQTWFELAGQKEPQAVLVNCQTPTVEQLPRWISQRAYSMKLEIVPEAINLLCYSYENNLLALKQVLQLLDLLYPDHKLTFNRVNSVIEQSSVFTVFQWIDTLLEGKLERAVRILQGLKAEDVQPIILLRALQRELLTILQLTQPQQHIANIDIPLVNSQLKERFDRLKVWQNRRPFFIQAIQRMTYRKLYMIIQQLADLERKTKADFSHDIWNELDNLSAKICCF